MREITVMLTVLAAAWAVAGIGAWWVLARRDRPIVALGAGVVAVVVTACVSLVGAVLVGAGFFGVFHGLYLATTMSVPLLAVAALGLGIARTPSPAARRPAALAAATVLLIPGAVGFYATHVAPFQLRVDHVDAAVQPGRAGDDTIRIAVLADIQTNAVGDLEREAVRRAMAAAPDIVVLPGDLFQGTEDQLRDDGPALRDLLGALHAPGGVYVVGGDSDDRHRLAAVVPPSMTLLADQVVTTTVGDRSVAIGGTVLDVGSPGAERTRQELVEQPPGTVRVLVSHRPDTVLRMPTDSGVDLTVAGHTHGGQIALPVIGPIVTLTRVPRSVAAGGLHAVDGNQIYLSSGIGMERGTAPQVRFLVPPTVGIIDLG